VKTPLLISLASNMLGFMMVGMHIEANEYSAAVPWGLLFAAQAIYNLKEVNDL